MKKYFQRDDGSRPQLHFSHISRLTLCGEAFRRIYLCGDRSMPGVGLIVGSSVHDVVEKDLKFKGATKELMKDDAVKDAARDAFVSEWESHPILFDDDEREKGIEKVKGESLDMTVTLASLHHTCAAPHLWIDSPDDVERLFVIDTSARGYDFDIAGKIDVTERGVKGDSETGAMLSAIRDTKTKKTSPPADIADCSEQLTIYAMAHAILEGAPPSSVHFDYLIKTKTPQCKFFQSTRTNDDFKMFLRRFERYVETIQKGIFLPADASSWVCSKRFCGFAHDGSCPYFRRKVMA